MKEEIIKYGINVRECPHINAYNPNKPICQKGVGVGGNSSECDGNCDYVRNADIEQKIRNLSELVSWQREKLEEIKGDLEQDTTCESRECGCDDYGECLKCVKETILDKISEVLK